MTGNQAVVATPHVPREGVTALCNGLQKTEKNYTPRICRQEHLSEVLDLYIFVTSHISLTLYSFDFHEWSDVSYCGVKRNPSQFQVLAIQRQPTPRLDKNRGTRLLATIVGARKVAANCLSEPTGRRRTGSLCS